MSQELSAIPEFRSQTVSAPSSKKKSNSAINRNQVSIACGNVYYTAMENQAGVQNAFVVISRIGNGWC